MKYTERFFKFPIRLYDGIELRKAMENEEKLFDIDPDSVVVEETPWVQGTAAIYAEDIYSYNETFSRGTEIEEVVKSGGDLTHIESKTGDYICMWPIKKFEQKLNEHMALVEEYHRLQTSKFANSAKEISTNSINKEELKD